MENRGAARDELLHQIILGGAAKLIPTHALLFRDHEVEREEERRRRVDRHRGVDRSERDALEQLLHVAPMANRNAGLADLAARDWSIGVVAILCREIERDREAFLARFQILMEPLIGLTRVAETRIGSDDPWLAFRRGLFGFAFGLGH